MAGVRVQDHGISVRFGDADTFAPEGVIAAAGPPRIVVAVSPPDPRLRVSVQMTIGEGEERAFSLRPGGRGRAEQLFEGTFQGLRAGDEVRYAVRVELERLGGTVRLDSSGYPGGIRLFELSGRAARRGVIPAGRPQPAPANTPVAASAAAEVGRTATPSTGERAATTSGAFKDPRATAVRDLAATRVEAIARSDVAHRDEAVAAEARAALPKAHLTETLSPSRVALAGSTLRSGKDVVTVNPEVIARAWSKNAELDLLQLDLSKDSADRAKLDLTGMAPAERKGFIRDIQVRKSSVRATAGNADIAAKLLGKGIKAPGKVWPGLLAEAGGISVGRATNIHERDIQHFGRLSQGLFALIDAHSGGLQRIAAGNLRPAKILDFVRGSETGEKFDSLDNIQELFGDLDSCDCRHCNSILGPAAYFVDLMHFVQTHVLDDEVPGGQAPFAGKQAHPLHLKTRRPDLWTLPLTCANTTTEIPQLLITTEILENYLATRRGVTLTPDRAPVVAKVYGDLLPAGRSSILQPFVLPLEELELYLQHSGLCRHDVARSLDAAEAVQLRTALGLTAVQAELIATADASSVNIRAKLGLTIPVNGIVGVRELLDATGLARDELGDLLLSRFVGSNMPLAIRAEKKSADSVQNDIERVHGVELEHLDRVHRLLRLRRQLAWRFRELDGFLAATGGGLDTAALADAGRAALVQKQFKASAQDLCAIRGELPDFPIEPKAGDQERSPYDELFNLPDLMRHEGRYPNPSIRYDTGATTPAARERSMRLRAGLRLDEPGLTALIDGLAHAFRESAPANPTAASARFLSLRLRTLPKPSLPRPVAPVPPAASPLTASAAGTFPLSAHNLSLLVRHALLARWLKLDTTDLFTLARLTPQVGNHVATLSDALAVVRFHQWWKLTKLSLEELSLLLAPLDALAEPVLDMWNALQAWLAEHDDVSFGDTLFTQVEGVNEELSRKLVALNIGQVFEAEGDRFRVSATAKVESLDAGPLAGTAIDIEAIHKLVRERHPNERVPRALERALSCSIEIARVIVAAVLSDPGAPSPAELLRSGPMPESVKPTIVAMLRLHRIGVALKLEPGTLERVLGAREAFGVSTWTNPDAAALRRIVATQDLLKERFADNSAPAVALVLQVLGDNSRLADAAVGLFAIEPLLARDVVSRCTRPENVVDALFAVKNQADLACRLGVDAATLAGVVSEDIAVASGASAAVIAGFRAKYLDEDTWKAKVEPYQQRLLEKKRDALLDYLTKGTEPEFSDAAEIYKYFLIDSEVDGCFPTSRVVASSSSLQLYVHRIRMNLEKEQNGVHVLPSLIPSEEWEWRQHYRQWEANRKIFLWPENYLDPTIRDDKTPLFEQLESELLERDITEQSVVDAYSNYLRRLEELSNLRYAGAFHHYVEDDESGETSDILYLFGATGGDSPTHYVREARNLARNQDDELAPVHFGPWRQIEARIPVRHVSPVVYDGQLRVFWNEIATTPQNSLDDGKSKFIGYSHRYSLKCTSLQLDGRWTPPEAIGLLGSAATFKESASAIDDPLTEISEFVALTAAFLATLPWFGIFQDTKAASNFEDAQRRALTPRWGGDAHTKAREGYTLSGFLWERPHVSADPSYGNRLLINCAGMLVRGAVDLFDRQVLPVDDTQYKTSPVVERELIAYRSGGPDAAADFTLLRRGDAGSLSQITWSACPFDYPVAAAIALHTRELDVFERHWGGLNWSGTEEKVAEVPDSAGVWAVAGTPGELLIETEDDVFLLQPSAKVADQYVLRRVGTTLVRKLARTLFSDGVRGLLATKYQLDLKEPAASVSGPRTHDRSVRNPIANDAAYGVYFQEIFQHIPLLIAHYLNAAGKFEQAQRWYHYVFDPTSPEPPTDAAAPDTDRNWKYRQFRGQEQAKLRDVLTDTTAIQKYREDPFNAHAIARLRVTAYQKFVVMRYIDNLLDWADELFTRFQMESVNHAMMLYVTAAEVLGPRPIPLGACGELSNEARTYDRLKDAFSKDGDFLLEVEQLIPAPEPAVPPGLGFGIFRPQFGWQGLLFAALASAGALAGQPETVGTGTSGTSGAGSPAGGGIVGIKPGFGRGAGPVHSGMPLIGKGTGRPTSGTPDATRSTVTAPKGPTATGPLFTGSAGKGPSGHVVGGGAAVAAALGAVNTLGAGVVAGVVPGRKSVAPLQITDAIIKAFGRRQQFQFLADAWKARGGFRIPSTLGDRFGRAMARHVSAAFCIPRNEILEDYWDRVEDRIQKIRTCRDITGRKRKLSLFAPPIDPMLLARARAAGINLEDAVGAFDGMIPQYRFHYLLQKAKEFTGTVQSFGAALQSALDRKDAEELMRLQTTQQQQILALTTKAKEWELESAKANLEATERRKAATENRRAHYAGLLEAGLNEWETAEAIATHTASVLNGAAATMEFLSGVLHLIPQAGSPFAMKYGGLETGTAMDRIHGGMGMLARVAQAVATSASLEARNDRRREDWEFQRDQSRDELSQIEKQIEAGKIACSLAEHAIKVHEKNVAHNDELHEYHSEKFSGLGLYTWLSTQLQRAYHDAYQMAYRMARYAEQAYRFEREDYSSSLLSDQYWDVGRAGLLAANRLTLDLQLLEQRYLESDVPKREITDHFFSLRQWDPKALIQLRHGGKCTFTVPELFFDLAMPGAYRRRLRSVRVTIPAVAGPYVNVMATVELTNSQMRFETNADLQDGPRPRVDSISTSSARNDAGAFELNFRGDKYAPFEGAGAVSEWSLTLPTSVRMFDYGTISDVVLHLDYTASFDEQHRDVVQGVTSGIVASVQERLAGDGLVRVFSTRDEFRAEHQRLLAGDTVEFEITDDHLPFFLRRAQAKPGTSLIFATDGDDASAPADIIFDGTSLGPPSLDKETEVWSLSLPMSGPAPWKHKLRIAGLAASTSMYLAMKLGA